VQTPPRYPLPTDTAHVKIESRQYEILGRDLGEGIAREKLLLGAIIVGGWVGLAVLVGVPFLSAIGPEVYIAPPLLGTWWALRTDDGGRPTYAAWLDRFRYLLRRHRPIVPSPAVRPVHRLLVRLEPLIRPTRRPGAARPFTAAAEFDVLDLTPEQEAVTT